MKTLHIVVTLIAVACILGGCDKRDQTATLEKSQPMIKIDSIRPDVAIGLKKNAVANIEVEVIYTSTEDAAAITLSAQRAEATVIAQTTKLVSKGHGRIKLSLSFATPETSIVQAFVSLANQGQASTSIVDFRTFKVLDK